MPICPSARRLAGTQARSGFWDAKAGLQSLTVAPGRLSNPPIPDQDFDRIRLRCVPMRPGGYKSDLRTHHCQIEAHSLSSYSTVQYSTVQYRTVPYLKYVHTKQPSVACPSALITYCSQAQAHLPLPALLTFGATREVKPLQSGNSMNQGGENNRRPCSRPFRDARRITAPTSSLPEAALF
jgi:hypothetical protein